MASSSTDNDSSEDEVFFGPSTLKEIRARLLPKQVRRHMIYANKKKKNNEIDNSITIIEMHSEPEMNINNDLIDSPNLSTVFTNYTDCVIKQTDNSYLKLSPNDSFIKLEKQVAECCISEQTHNHTLNNNVGIDNFLLKKSPVYWDSRDEKNDLLNNTIDISFQLRNNPKIQVQDEKLIHNDVEISKEKTNNVHDSENKRNEKIGTVKLLTHGPREKVSTQQHNPKILVQDHKLEHYDNETSQVKTNKVLHESENNITIQKIEKVQLKTHGICDNVSTQNNKIPNTDIFKTPVSTRKQQASSIKNSQSKVKGYQHVASPIAIYIKSPQFSLLRSNCPKPQSFIPTLKKFPMENKISNKENVQLQTTGCGIPKVAAVVHNSKKLLHSDWSKRGTPSANVLRKNAPQDVTTSKKLFVPQDDSIDNLSLKSQADVYTDISE
ncbi:uncharacterized protein LOC120634494 [Pararge aegeria]|uniref:uncharacterized protein LOC120634494 n=1 Tax=Pararge aegeria TaxID=116150 RepID=UPI0019D1EA18|nr:uncharacterized protein LOC120634494 [Pararge aegeria]XP_039761090.1 uncharacterized protein LOC120634494 [Pararge aegeria]